MRRITRVRLIRLAGCLMLASLWPFLAIPRTALAKKPPNAGGGDGGFIGVNVTLIDGGLIFVSSDGGGTYFDGVDIVLAITGDGFRFDTDGTSKIIHKNQVRYVDFDFTGAAFDPLPGFPPNSEPGVDARMDHETDELGVPLGTGWLHLMDVLPGETRYAEYIINFGFKNSEGDEEKWQLAYGTPPGLDPDTDLPFFGEPVQVIGGADTNNDGLSDSWTITGTLAGMRRLRVGKRSNPIYVGQDVMPFTMFVERQ